MMVESSTRSTPTDTDRRGEIVARLISRRPSVITVEITLGIRIVVAVADRPDPAGGALSQDHETLVRALRYPVVTSAARAARARCHSGCRLPPPRSILYSALQSSGPWCGTISRVDGWMRSSIFRSRCRRRWPGIALTNLYAENGWLGSLLAPLGVKVAFTPLGIFVALVFTGLPFVVRTVQPVLEDLDAELEEVSATLGASRWTRWPRHHTGHCPRRCSPGLRWLSPGRWVSTALSSSLPAICRTCRKSLRC